MKSVQSTEAYQNLQKQITATLDRIAENNPKDAAELRTLIVMLESALGASTDVGKYAGFRKAIDAVIACLEKAGHPMKRMDIAKEIVEGGFAPQHQGRKWLVTDAIRYHSGQLENESPRLIDYGDDTFGLAEWGNRFSTQKKKPGKKRQQSR
jgi:hypothetical protein